MKINHHPNVIQAMKIYDKTNHQASSVKESQRCKDQLQLSDGAKDFQVAVKAFNKLPEIREEKVKALKEKIQQGTYDISGKEIADKIIASIHIDKKI
ncbi:flagellar biosynthesis anti-sigma factor FlgM [Alkaliphilus crotonatoxidans]